eukprot:scaffold1803_cov92-Amphora_coffeaeformis.AAC.11
MLADGCSPVHPIEATKNHPCMQGGGCLGCRCPRGLQRRRDGRNMRYRKVPPPPTECKKRERRGRKTCPSLLIFF